MPAGVISKKSAQRLSPAKAVLQHVWRQTKPRFPRAVRTPFKSSKTGDGTQGCIEHGSSQANWTCLMSIPNAELRPRRPAPAPGYAPQ